LPIQQKSLIWGNFWEIFSVEYDQKPWGLFFSFTSVTIKSLFIHLADHKFPLFGKSLEIFALFGKSQEIFALFGKSLEMFALFGKSLKTFHYLTKI
jgi:hypothetical protein